jgi:protein TonB
MTIYKYLLPASIAATVHVALLWLLPEGDYVRTIAVPLNPPGEKPPKDLPVPAEDAPETPVSGEVVKPLLGKPAPPTLDDVPPTRLPDDAITILAENRPRTFDREITQLPTIGSDVGRPDGIDRLCVGIFSRDALDQSPRAKVQLPPDYPYAMKQAGTSGRVMVEFDVDPSGRVIRAEAISCTEREFAEPAVRAVKKWRFEPGRRNGKAMSFRMAVPIEFGIENSK